MKNTKKLLLVFLALAVMLSLFACGADTCTAHTDNNSDGKCDTCGTEVKDENNTDTGNAGTDLVLIKDGAIKFQIVRSKSIGSGALMVLNSLKMQLSGIGAELEIVDDKESTVQDVEILIGDVTTRGEEYTYDKYSLGEEGYIIKKIGNKIIINAGSENKLVDTVEDFIKNILGIKSNVTALADVTMTDDKSKVEIQTGYRITSIKVNGQDLKGYTIAYDYSVSTHQDAASELKKFLYSKAGYYLPIVQLSEAGKSIIIEAVEDAGPDGFRVRTDENNALHIECAYANAFSEAFSDFVNNEFRLKEGDLHFDSSYEYTDEVSVVYYEDFGAKGDGYTDDYAAIKATHEYANQCGQTVKAKRNGKYLIKDIVDKYGDGRSIIIKTNVEWGMAEIIIDDTILTGKADENNKNIFYIASDYEPISLSSTEVAAMFPGGINAKEVTKIDWKFDFPALVIVTNKEHKNYIRYGGDANNGAHQQELIIVDANGNIDPTANFMLDYEKVTGVDIYRIDDKPITISGGKFTTIASQLCEKDSAGNYKTTYYNRGLQVSRSNTTVTGVKHYVTGELPDAPHADRKGPSYHGFFNSSNASNVSFVNCVMTARRYYKIAGTYGFGASLTNNIVLKDCVQSNFYLLDDKGNPTETSSMLNGWYWGLGGTNYCKNMIYDGCELTRYDAHAGVHNGKILNSKVTAINLIGGGDMLIENTIIEPINTSTNLITLRADYGSTWKGTITIRDCTVKNPTNVMNVISMPWVNHYFGYTCYMPNLIIDGINFTNPINQVHIVMKSTNAGYYSVATELNMHEDVTASGAKNINRVATPQFIKVLKTNGVRYAIYDVPFFYATEVTGDVTQIPA